MTLNMSLLVLVTLTMGGKLSAQVHTAPRLHQDSDSEMCVGTLKAYTVRTVKDGCEDFKISIFCEFLQSLIHFGQCDTNGCG